MRHVYAHQNLVLICEDAVSRFEIEYDDCLVVGSIAQVADPESADWTVDGVFLKLISSDCLGLQDFLRVTDEEFRGFKIELALWHFGDLMTQRIVDALKMRV